jgi:type III secretory pathway component EscS
VITELSKVIAQLVCNLQQCAISFITDLINIQISIILGYDWIGISVLADTS